MKKKIWDKGLYIEGLRRGRTMTIVFAIIALLTVLFTCASVMSEGREIADTAEYGTFVASEETGDLYAWFSIAIFLVAAPFLTLRTFSFLNSRASCDFWHAIPHTRTCLYVSFLSALLTEYVFLLAVTGVSAWLAFLVSSRFIRLVPGTLILFLTGAFAASLLTTGVLTLAMSRTGTLLSNIVIGGIILALPRTLILCVTEMIIGSLPQVYDSNIFPFSDPGYNIPFGIIAGFDPDTVRLPSSILYTAALGVIYLVIALCLFRTRKSESAGVAAPSRRLQTVCRIAVGCSVSFIVTVCLVGELMNGSTYYLPFMIFYTIAAILYFVYELMTTKRAKNLVKALPGLCVVIALNIILGFAVYGIYVYEDAFGKNADKIKSVSLISDSYENRYTITLTEYALNCCGESRITDRELIGMLSDALNTNTERTDKGQIATVKIEIRTAVAAKNRRVFLTSKQMTKLTEGLKNTDEFNRYMTEIPKADEYGNNAWIVNSKDGNHYESTVFLDGEKTDVIRSLLAEDIKALGTEKWLEMNYKTQTESEDGYGFLLLEISGGDVLSRNGRRYHTSVRIPISLQETPGTFAKLLEYDGEQAEHQ